MGTPESRHSILMFPWVAHGHIFPYLELSRALVARKDLHIHFCSTSINFDSINAFIKKNSLQDSISLVELELEPIPDLPPHYHTTKNLPGSLKLTLIKAFQTSNTSFSNIITRINPNLVIYDMFQPWAAKIAASRGIPAVHFLTVGAAPVALVHHRHTFGSDATFPFPEMQFEKDELKDLIFALEFLNSNIHEVDDKDFFFGNFKHSNGIVMIKTSRAIEEKYLDYLSTMSERKIIPLGPLVVGAHQSSGDDGDSRILRWLSTKRKDSTLFISFGSEYFLSKDEIEEIAKALELCSSNINFIWIIRSPVGSTSGEDALPRGFLERTKERGLVVTGWAPQAGILGHESTGGFVTHCGWSSVMESVYFGVPAVAMPMKVDQPVNARMLAEAGGGVEVERAEGGVYKGEEIAAAIEKVMVGEGGAWVRRRAREMRERLRRREEEAEGLDGVAEQLWQMCLNK